MFKAFGINLAATLAATLLSTLATVLLIRYLGPTAWGAGASLLGLGQLAGAILSFGSQIERVRRYSMLGNDERATEARLDSLLRGIVSVVLVLVGSAVLAAGSSVGAGIMCAAGVYASLGATNFFIAARQFVRAGVISICEKGVLLGAIAAAVHTDQANALTLPVVQGFTGCLAGFVTLIAVRKPLTRLSITAHVRRVAMQYKSAKYLALASLAPSFLLLDASLVLLLSSPADAGQFSLASRLVAPLSLATTSIVTVLLPFMVRAEPGRALLHRGAATAMTVAFFVALCGLMLSATWWVPTVFGQEYVEAVLPVRLYIANTFLAFFTRILVTAAQARHDDRATSMLVACQVVAALSGIALGAHVAGAAGAAASVLVTNVLLAVALVSRRARLGRNKTT